MLAAIGSGLRFGNMLSDSASTPFFDELLGVNIPISVVAGISLPVFLLSMVTLLFGGFSHCI